MAFKTQLFTSLGIFDLGYLLSRLGTALWLV
nr:MAG TPA: hypothetical protein [Caudoviricetes sp.]